MRDQARTRLRATTSGARTRATRAFDLWQSVVRLAREDGGQDIIEYALLGAFIGVVGVVAWQNVGVSVFNKYTGWDTGIQDLSSCTPDPGGGGC